METAFIGIRRTGMAIGHPVVEVFHSVNVYNRLAEPAQLMARTVL